MSRDETQRLAHIIIRLNEHPNLNPFPSARVTLPDSARVVRKGIGSAIDTYTHTHKHTLQRTISAYRKRMHARLCPDDASHLSKCRRHYAAISWARFVRVPLGGGGGGTVFRASSLMHLSLLVHRTLMLLWRRSATVQAADAGRCVVESQEPDSCWRFLFISCARRCPKAGSDLFMPTRRKCGS